LVSICVNDDHILAYFLVKKFV